MFNVNRTVGQRITYYRKQKGLKQYELAALAGIRQERLSNIENGIGTVGIPRLTRIAWALGMPLSELLGDRRDEGLTPAKSEVLNSPMLRLVSECKRGDKILQTRLYAAYGSNMNLAQMARRCPKAKVVGKGVLNNYRLTFRGTNNGVANIEEYNGRSVPIVLWQITAACEKALDIYEGFPRFYIKKDIDVETADGTVWAMAYVMVKQYEKMPAKPNEHYYNIIAQGYAENGLEQDALERAHEECLQELESEEF